MHVTSESKEISQHHFVATVAAAADAAVSTLLPDLAADVCLQNHKCFGT
jgi:hypothetical protein